MRANWTVAILLGSWIPWTAVALPQPSQVPGLPEAHDWSEQQLVGLPSGMSAPSFEVSVRVDGELMTLELSPHSMRSPDFQLIDDGEFSRSVVQDLPPACTYRGLARSAGASPRSGHVAATLSQGQLRAVIAMDDGSVREIQPLARGAGWHAILRAEDLDSPEGLCGVLDGAHGLGADQGSAGASQRAGSLVKAEIAFDADFPFYQANGSNLNNTLLDIETVMNVVDGIYENDVSCVFEITTVIVRTSNGSNPYSTTDPGGLLNQFESLWNTNNTPIKRDVAHLMTGVNLSGSVIGIASLGSVCFNSSAYGLSQSRFTSNLTSRAGLTAHELGHNFGANHCNGASDCYIMCSGLGGCGGRLDRFGTSSVNAITNLLTTRACFEGVFPTVSLPFFDDFETGTLDPSLWSHQRRVFVDTGCVRCTSGTMAAHLNSLSAAPYHDDELRTNTIDLSSVSEAYLCFFSEHRFAEPGEFLQVDFWSSNQLWEPLLTLTSDGSLQTYFRYQRTLIPAAGYHSEFRVRFVNEGDEPDDSWFLENVQVTTGLSHSVQPLIPGQDSEFRGFGGIPGEQMWFVYTFGGLGNGPLVLPGLTLDVLGQVFILGAPTADGTGRGAVNLTVPPGASGADIYTQVVIARSGTDSVKSNPVASIVQ